MEFTQMLNFLNLYPQLKINFIQNNKFEGTMNEFAKIFGGQSSM